MVVFRAPASNARFHPELIRRGIMGQRSRDPLLADDALSSTPSAMDRACHRHTTGFDLPDDLGGTAAIVRRQDDDGAPHVLLRRAAVGDDRLKLTAVAARDGHHNSCSHHQSLNRWSIWDSSE
jgi:hypothetical protein